MGVIADDLNRPDTMANLAGIKSTALAIKQRQRERDRLEALKNYLQPKTELTPDTQSSIDQVRAARGIPVQPKGAPSVQAGATGPSPDAQTQIPPEQTVTRRRRLSEASPEELSDFGMNSGDIFYMEAGQESQQAKQASELGMARTKSELDKERELSVERARGENAINTEKERAKTRHPKVSTLEHYIETYGDEEGLKRFTADEAKVRASGRGGAARTPGTEFSYNSQNPAGGWDRVYGYYNKDGEEVVTKTQPLKGPPSKSGKKDAVGEFLDKLGKKGKEGKTDSAKMSQDDFKSDFEKEQGRVPTQTEIDNAKGKYWE
jgi:hypothetical protein